MTDRIPASPVEVNTEAGDYIEDDPKAWAAFVEAVGRYAGYSEGLAKDIGPEGAAEVIAGSMLSYLADQHGLLLTRAALQAQDHTITKGGLAEQAMREAVEYGYQRGQADTSYGRGYRPTLAAANYVAEQLAKETIRAALEPTHD